MFKRQEKSPADVVIRGLTSRAEGVAKLPEGSVVFIPGVVPGDRVRIKLAGRQKGTIRAELLEILEPSKDRVNPLCTVKGCGGCALQHVAFAAQSDLKRQRVIDDLQRLGGIDVSSLNSSVQQIGDGWRYRNRVHLHAAHQDGDWRLGYYAPQSHDLITFDKCLVLSRDLEQLVKRLENALKKIPAQADLRDVFLTNSPLSQRSAARFIAQGDLSSFRSSLAWWEDSGLSGIEVQSPNQTWRHGNLELKYPHQRFQEYTLSYQPGVFTQAFPAMNDKLIQKVLNWVCRLSPRSILEFHAGIGNFTLPLALTGITTQSVEKNLLSSILCRRNTRSAGLEVDVYQTHDEDPQILQSIADFDCVILDPPRTGARTLIEALAKHHVVSQRKSIKTDKATRRSLTASTEGEGGTRSVIYISCHTATLARDASILLRGGYRATAMANFDMFPQTAHIETALLFEY